MTLFESHHSGEEHIAFPLLAAKVPGVDFSLLVRQHQDMHRLTDRLMGLCQAAKQEQLSLQQSAPLLEELLALWQEHREMEEQQLSAHGQKQSQPGALVLPFLLFNLEPSAQQTFASQLPWVVTKILVPWVWRGRWQTMKPFLLA